MRRCAAWLLCAAALWLPIAQCVCLTGCAFENESSPVVSAAEPPCHGHQTEIGTNKIPSGALVGAADHDCTDSAISVPGDRAPQRFALQIGAVLITAPAPVVPITRSERVQPSIARPSTGPPGHFVSPLRI